MERDGGSRSLLLLPVCLIYVTLPIEFKFNTIGGSVICSQYMGEL